MRPPADEGGQGGPCDVILDVQVHGDVLDDAVHLSRHPVLALRGVQQLGLPVHRPAGHRPRRHHNVQKLPLQVCLNIYAKLQLIKKVVVWRNVVVKVKQN